MLPRAALLLVFLRSDVLTAPLLSALGAALTPATSAAAVLRPERRAVDDGGGGGGVVELAVAATTAAASPDLTFPAFLLEFRLLDLSRNRFQLS